MRLLALAIEAPSSRRARIHAGEGRDGEEAGVRMRRRELASCFEVFGKGDRVGGEGGEWRGEDGVQVGEAGEGERAGGMGGRGEGAVRELVRWWRHGLGAVVT